MMQTSRQRTEKRRKLVIINECDICMETYNKKLNKPILCEYCPMEVCRSCCERYILGEKIVKCMSIYCNREWSRKYIASQFTATFIEGPLKERRRTVLYEKEREKFPYTLEKMGQLDDLNLKINTYDIDDINKNIHEINRKCHEIPQQFAFQRDNYVKRINKINKKIRKQIQNESDHVIWNNFVKQYSEIVTNMNASMISFVAPNIPDDLVMSEEKHKIIKVFNKCIETYLKSKKDYNALYDKRSQYIHMTIELEQLNAQREMIWDEIETNPNEQQQSTIRNVNINKCPTQDCKGILNAEWHCILCNVDACSSCHEIKGEEHKCDSNTVETVKMLNTDTKACPKCYTSIYKIDGCDQMWCVKCHTAFSWKTGAIETKIHNPHYYEWMRKNSANGLIPREVGDNQACEAINENTAINYTLEFKKYYIDDMLMNDLEIISSGVLSNVQHFVHLTEVVLPRYRDETDLVNEFIMRTDFLKNEINEKNYKMNLEKEAKKKSKNAEVRQVVQLWIDAKSDILRRVMDVVRIESVTFENVLDSLHNQQNIIKEMNELDEYMKTLIKEIETVYNNVIKL
jgi:hypothetical protein